MCDICDKFNCDKFNCDNCEKFNIIHIHSNSQVCKTFPVTKVWRHVLSKAEKVNMIVRASAAGTFCLVHIMVTQVNNESATEVIQNVAHIGPDGPWWLAFISWAGAPAFNAKSKHILLCSKVNLTLLLSQMCISVISSTRGLCASLHANHWHATQWW